ncbi:hypothetical protein MMC25_002643 [Agyrium rufum]|nr:hypothetical protein [Agyrium rufum]
MYAPLLILAFVVAMPSTLAAPAAAEERAVTSIACSSIKSIVSVFSVSQATSFCSSYLSIKTSTVTSTVTKTSVTTVTTGTASTIYTFVPGNPPSATPAGAIAVRRSFDGIEERAKEAHVEVRAPAGIPPYATTIPSATISSACSCLSLATPTTTKTTTTTKVSKTTVSAPYVTESVYPCADNFTLFGSVNTTSPDIVSSENNLFYNASSLADCCAECFFETQYCTAAYAYPYGCVLTLNTVVGDFPGADATCPQGKLPGESYEPQNYRDPRTPGTLAGPCGTVYNLPLSS